MKNFAKILCLYALLLAGAGCTDWDDHLERPDTPILEEVSPNDPNNTGLSQSCPGIPQSPEVFDSILLDPNLPDNYDLSPLMPPVRSQGSQASCTAWATTYYMKSYQEKVQHGYEYTDFNSVMSPAYIYNQTKAGNGCSVGSCIENALYVLKTQGAATWQQFPYGPDCSILPTPQQMDNASNHKIAQGYIISSQTELNGVMTPRTTIIKNLLVQGNPVIIGMALDAGFENATPRNSENLYIYNYYDSMQHVGNHAMLIVGYDDSLNAFKVINSWGTAWGNDGYCWVSYNFFKLPSDPEWIGGNLGTYVAYDQ